MNEAEKMMRGAQMLVGTFDQLAKQKEEGQYNQYLDILGKSESLESVQPPEGSNPRIWNKAVVDQITKVMTEGEYQQQRFTLLKTEMAGKREMILENARRAESLVTTNAGAALDAYMESYSAHPNGVNVKRNPESGMWDFEDVITGNKWSENVSLDDARQMTQALLPPGEYEKMYLTDRSRVINFNKVGMINPDLMENASGDKVSVFTLIDPNTGSKVLKVLGSDGKLDDLDPEELLHGGFKMIKDSREDRMAELGIKKAELQVARQEQQMRHADENMGLRRQQVDKQLSQSPGIKTGKLSQTEEVMTAYNIDKATAMDIIRSDKSLPQRLSMAKEQIKEAMLDPQDPKDGEKIMGILKQYKVDKLPGHEGYGREEEAAAPKQETHKTGALPGRFVKPGEAPQGGDSGEIINKLQSAFPDAPDGTIKRHKSGGRYIKIQGQWKLVEG